MKTSLSRQTGMTMGGLILILAFIATLVTFVVRAFPLYNEKMQVVSAMNSVVSRPEAAGMSERELASAFLKNIQATTNLRRFTNQNIKDYVEVVKPETRGDPKLFRVHYQATNVLVRDLHLMLEFDTKLPLRGKASDDGE